jgi:hypothetical protein
LGSIKVIDPIDNRLTLIENSLVNLNMAIPESISEGLNEQQIMMMRLLKQPMAEDDFLQIRRLAVKLLSKQLDETVEDWENQNNITSDTYEHLAQKHFRSTSKGS